MDTQNATKSHWWPRLWAWAISLPFAAVTLLGVLGWWLAGAAAFYGPATGLDEPYFGWSGTKHGMQVGLSKAIVLAALFVMPGALLPALVASAIRWNQSRKRSARSEFGSLRAWLISSWVVMPVLLVLAPFVGLAVAHSETMSDPADAMPASVGWILVPALGSLLSIFVIAMLALSVPIHFAAVFSRWVRTQANTCGCCGYDMTGLQERACCPECGQEAKPNQNQSPSAQSGPLANKPWAPFKLLLVWMIVALLAQLVRASGTSGSASTGRALLSFSSMLAALFGLSVLFAYIGVMRSAVANESFTRLCKCMLWMMIPVALCVAAEYVAYRVDSAKHPGNPAYWDLWWSVHIPVRRWLIPIVYTLTVTWWLLANGLNAEPQAAARPSPG